jgi:hypothetical protein
MKIPSSPIRASQPIRTAASTATLTGASPITARRTSSGCAKEEIERRHRHNAHGDPLIIQKRLCASSAISTSDPEAKIVTSAAPGAGDNS